MALALITPETESTSVDALVRECLERGRRIATLEAEALVLRESLRKRDAAFARLEEQHAELGDAFARVERERDQLLRRFVQPTTEKLAPDQLRLSFPDELAPAPVETTAPEAAGSSDEGKPPRSKRRNEHGRKKLPANLERVPNRIEPPADQLVCACGKHKVEIPAFHTSSATGRIPVRRLRRAWLLRLESFLRRFCG